MHVSCVGSGTLNFQGKMAFGVLGPVSVSAARRRLEAGAARLVLAFLR